MKENNNINSTQQSVCLLNEFQSDPVVDPWVRPKNPSLARVLLVSLPFGLGIQTERRKKVGAKSIPLPALRKNHARRKRLSILLGKTRSVASRLRLGRNLKGVDWHCGTRELPEDGVLVSCDLASAAEWLDVCTPWRLVVEGEPLLQISRPRKPCRIPGVMIKTCGENTPFPAARG